jgi:hypothetical protein
MHQYSLLDGFGGIEIVSRGQFLKASRVVYSFGKLFTFTTKLNKHVLLLSFGGLINVEMYRTFYFNLLDQVESTCNQVY